MPGVAPVLLDQVAYQPAQVRVTAVAVGRMDGLVEAASASAAASRVRERATAPSHRA